MGAFRNDPILFGNGNFLFGLQADFPSLSKDGFSQVYLILYNPFDSSIVPIVGCAGSPGIRKIVTVQCPIFKRGDNALIG